MGMAKTWILVADARRARFFQREASESTLMELTTFVYPQARHSGYTAQGGVSGDAGKGHGRTAHSGKQFEPHTDLRAGERTDFSRQLARYINDGLLAKRFHDLVLIATAPMLGQIRPLLSKAAEVALHSAVAMDLTVYQGEDLHHRIEEAIRQPG